MLAQGPRLTTTTTVLALHVLPPACLSAGEAQQQETTRGDGQYSPSLTLPSVPPDEIRNHPSQWQPTASPHPLLFPAYGNRRGAPHSRRGEGEYTGPLVGG